MKKRIALVGPLSFLALPGLGYFEDAGKDRGDSIITEDQIKASGARSVPEVLSTLGGVCFVGIRVCQREWV